ncbi:hypothetical protein [Halorubrum tebenquichense]|uniref:Uncharacterized protein n=1 Tax=Halorubrum tebenquichense DSM 14210 TaxID=1227485 RepID=M0DVZ6_9EURY|nr:hypothetical protein [Halorubrum tebenquichense]ELZ38882.1 hypothetical protein C472_05698 [Halorubrum tebenquichense DSM 14210]
MSSNEEEGSILPTWVITITTAGLGTTVASFARNPETFIYAIFVDGVLGAWGWLLDNVFGRLYWVIELALVDGVAVPLSRAANMAGSSLYGALISIQTWAEGEMMSLGIAAPFALAISWLIIATIVAIISQLLWGFIETYLPVDSVTGALRSLWSAIAGGDNA